MFVVRREVEGSGVGGGYVVYFDVHGEGVSCGLLQCSYYTEHGR